MIVRLITPDVLREPWEAIPGGDAGSAGPGPGTGLLLDLLAIVPAIGVLLRRAIDGSYRLRFFASHCVLFALPGFAVLSTAWSADKFAAAITAAHFMSACCLLWTMSQLVRSPAPFRLVAGLCFGLLLVMVVQVLEYKFVEAPQMVQNWETNKQKILRAQNLLPGSYAARQFEQKVLQNELLGTFKSPNTAAAVAVLLFFACVGIGLQKLGDGDDRRWLLLSIIAAGLLIAVLIKARSKTAIATPVLGVIVLAVFYDYRHRLRAHPRTAYLAGVGIVVLGIAAVAGHGLYHHGLFPGHFSNSLDFRWKYWVASTHIFAEHPWIGVGWSNFGPHYLAHRLPEAAEEVTDPHNFLVRFFTELGVIGGGLCILWLLRVGWEITGRAITAATGNQDELPLAIRSAVIAVLGGMLLSAAVNTDFSQPFLDVLSYLMKPLLFTLALLLGTIGAAMLSPRDWSLDTRPAPLVFYGTVTGIGLFCLHNLIDFSLFEAGAMFAVFALIGSAQGMAARDGKQAMPKPVAIGVVSTAAIVWLASAAAFVAPVVMAEWSAQAGDEAIRTAPTDTGSPDVPPHFRKAADAFAAAANLVPYNAEYVYREARAAISAGELPRANARLADARRMDPLMTYTWQLDAELQIHSQHPDEARILSDFQMLITLNPNNVAYHTEYAETLRNFGHLAQSRAQYQAAIDADAALPAGEPKRMSSDEVERLRGEIPRLAPAK